MIHAEQHMRHPNTLVEAQHDCKTAGFNITKLSQLKVQQDLFSKYRVIPGIQALPFRNLLDDQGYLVNIIGENRDNIIARPINHARDIAEWHSKIRTITQNEDPQPGVGIVESNVTFRRLDGTSSTDYSDSFFDLFDLDEARSPTNRDKLIFVMDTGAELLKIFAFLKNKDDKSCIDLINYVDAHVMSDSAGKKKPSSPDYNKYNIKKNNVRIFPVAHMSPITVRSIDFFNSQYTVISSLNKTFDGRQQWNSSNNSFVVTDPNTMNNNTTVGNIVQEYVKTGKTYPNGKNNISVASQTKRSGDGYQIFSAFNIFNTLNYYDQILNNPTTNIIFDRYSKSGEQPIRNLRALFENKRSEIVIQDNLRRYLESRTFFTTIDWPAFSLACYWKVNSVFVSRHPGNNFILTAVFKDNKYIAKPLTREEQIALDERIRLETAERIEILAREADLAEGVKAAKLADKLKKIKEDRKHREALKQFAIYERSKRADKRRQFVLEGDVILQQLPPAPAVTILEPLSEADIISRNEAQYLREGEDRDDNLLTNDILEAIRDVNADVAPVSELPIYSAFKRAMLLASSVIRNIPQVTKDNYNRAIDKFTPLFTRIKYIMTWQKTQYPNVVEGEVAVVEMGEGAVAEMVGGLLDNPSKNKSVFEKDIHKKSKRISYKRKPNKTKINKKKLKKRTTRKKNN